MVLNKNIGTTAAIGGASGTTYAPSLWLVGGNGVYTRTGTSDANYAFTKVAVDGIALTTKPTGISVNYTLNRNLPSGRTTSDISNWPTSTAATRQFRGFFASNAANTAADTAAYILWDTTQSKGILKDAGNTAAQGYNNTSGSQWKALYTLVHPSVSGSPTLKGYDFAGWATSASGNVISDFANHTIGANTNLYAKWTAKNYTISFDCDKPDDATQDVSSNPTPVTINMDGNVKLTQTCSLPGWTFAQWDCTSGALTSDSAGSNAVTSITAAQVGASGGYTVYMKGAKDVTCTAHWERNTINISWDAKNGTMATGTGAVSGSGTCDYDTDVQLPTNPTRTGFKFKGWQVASN